jgi:hypothetical protein
MSTEFMGDTETTNFLLILVIMVIAYSANGIIQAIREVYEQNEEFRKENFGELQVYIRQIKDRVAFTDAEKKKDAKERKEAEAREDALYEEELRIEREEELRREEKKKKKSELSN